MAKLSDYEVLRASNIERNNARLRVLGLISAKEEQMSNELAWRKELMGNTTSQSKNVSKQSGMKRKSSDSGVDGTRKSSRLQGNEPKKESESTLANEDPADRLLLEEREARVKECREIRLRRALEVSQAGGERSAIENPTATYQHCLMRVRTMTEKGLTNRVKAIERAAGKHCVVKMALFKSCLQDEGLWDLSELAAAALERLKTLKPPEVDE